MTCNEVVLGVLDSLRGKIAWFRRLGTMSREQLIVLAHDRLRVAKAWLDRDARLAEAMNRSMLKKAAEYCEELSSRPAQGFRTPRRYAALGQLQARVIRVAVGSASIAPRSRTPAFAW